MSRTFSVSVSDFALPPNSSPNTLPPSAAPRACSTAAPRRCAEPRHRRSAGQRKAGHAAGGALAV